MFGGLAFMVDNKMCITVSADRIMFRIDPAIHEEGTKRKGCRTVIMREREYKGYVHVSEHSIKNKRDFDYWIGLALNLETSAQATEHSKRKPNYPPHIAAHLQGAQEKQSLDEFGRGGFSVRVGVISSTMAINSLLIINVFDFGASHNLDNNNF
jgi:TfoX/Sxy family transcriptional regulator of competence genes